MKRFLSLLLVILLMSSFLCSCSGNKNNNEKGSTYIFTDSCGREVEIPKIIEKVASSGSNAERILYPICSDLLLGLSDSIPSDKAKYYDEDYVNLPVLGQFYGGKNTLNLEELLKQEPDIIIDMGDIKDSVKEDMNSIQEQTGIPTIFIEATMDTYSKAYTTLGQILQREEKAKELSNYVDRVLSISKENQKKIKEATTVLYTTGPDGLAANAKGSIQADVIDMVGASNPLVVDEVINKSGGNIISLEELYKIDPEVIIFDNQGGYENAKESKEWENLSAVKNNKIYEIPCIPNNIVGNPPSINRLLGILWLGNLLYPNYYDIDIQEEFITYYSLFYHYNLTKEEAKELIG